MAGSRLERFGTVFTRVRDLIRSGVIKPEKKPIWYDVYMAFPPKRDPLYVKKHTRLIPNKQDTVPEIFYKEDEVRAMFYKNYGTGSRALDLSKPNYLSTCQRFIIKYEELQRNSDLDEAALFEETGKALLKEGVVLRRRGQLPGEVSKEPKFNLKLKDMLAEQQPAETQTSEHETPEPHLIDSVHHK